MIVALVSLRARPGTRSLTCMPATSTHVVPYHEDHYAPQSCLASERAQEFLCAWYDACTQTRVVYASVFGQGDADTSMHKGTISYCLEYVTHQTINSASDSNADSACD